MKREEIKSLLENDINKLAKLNESDAKAIKKAHMISNLKIFKIKAKSAAPYILTYSLILATAKFTGLGLPFYTDYINEYTTDDTISDNFISYDEVKLLNGNLLVSSYFTKHNDHYEKEKTTYEIVHGNKEYTNYSLVRKKESDTKNYLVSISSVTTLALMYSIMNVINKKQKGYAESDNSMELSDALSEIENNSERLRIRKDNYDFLFKEEGDHNVKH